MPASSTPEARLLVVEDEPNIRELLSTSLRFAGFEVHTAADGATALKLAETTRPDLLVLDVMLPDMDGFAVTRRLRDRPGNVVLASHDGDFIPQVEALLGDDRRVGLLGFREFVNLRMTELAGRGLEILDLEHDVQAFTTPLPRVRIIPIEEFDPLRFL
jgi:CheY-like chemotaxis protein